jgi:flagellar basal-body rod protein FlgG
MLRGLYTSTNGMLTQQKRMDVVTQNLANASTIGYKSDNLVTRSFADQMISRLGEDAAAVGPLNTGIHIDEIITSFRQGTLGQTGLATDLALTGDAYFTVQTPAGERLTRSGQFTISATGYLTTPEGHAVLGMDGPLHVGSESFVVTPDGRVTTATGTNRIRLVGVADSQGLRKEGISLYQAAAANLVAPPAETEVRQGFLEGSNVDLSAQMVDMVDIYRSHEINQRMVRIFDDKLGKATSEIGRL